MKHVTKRPTGETSGPAFIPAHWWWQRLTNEQLEEIRQGLMYWQPATEGTIAGYVRRKGGVEHLDGYGSTGRCYKCGRVFDCVDCDRWDCPSLGQ
jgi:hypothetical protein